MKFKTLFFFLCFFLMSCGTNINQTKKNVKFKWPLKSFVKVEHRVYRLTCTPTMPGDLDGDCYEKPIFGGSGSGAIIGRTKEGSYVLTAGHVCDKVGVDVDPIASILFPEIHDTDDKELKRVFYVYDWDYFKYNAQILDIDKKEDLCLMHIYGLFERPLYLSKKRPKTGDRVYSMSAPGGIFQRRTVPLFEGLYSGIYQHYEFGRKGMYTFPVMGGMSGSAILNEKGAVVGVISAGNARFHHIMLGVPHDSTIDFIVRNVKKDLRRRSKPSNKRKIIKFK
jgi:S1-C subfamily serine protease